MINSQPAFCNINVQDADLSHLRELDPCQSEGYQSTGCIAAPVKIIHTSETGKQTTDTQILNLQVLTRWTKPITGKSKDGKSDTLLQSIRIFMTSEDDIFFNLLCNFNSGAFQTMKTKTGLNLHFADFVDSLNSILQNCSNDNPKQMNQAQLHLNYDNTGKLTIFQATQYKRIELLCLPFLGSQTEKIQQSIIFRYNYNKTKLALLRNSINSVYDLLAEKNPPLLAYIEKTVGDDDSCGTDRL